MASVICTNCQTARPYYGGVVGDCLVCKCQTNTTIKVLSERINTLERRNATIDKHRGVLMNDLEAIYNEPIARRLSKAELRIIRLEDQLIAAGLEPCKNPT